MWRTRAGLLLTTALVASAQAAGFKDFKEALFAVNIDAVVRVLGAPASTSTLGDNQFARYRVDGCTLALTIDPQTSNILDARIEAASAKSHAHCDTLFSSRLSSVMHQD